MTRVTSRLVPGLAVSFILDGKRRVAVTRQTSLFNAKGCKVRRYGGRGVDKRRPSQEIHVLQANVSISLKSPTMFEALW